jgi:large subunit ribosomal protein L17
MRHGKKINHLGRTAAHRQAMLSNMASSLILHKRVSTTVAKAKALRKYVEPLLTKSKNDTTHSRRTIFSYLQNKESLKELFDSVAGKIATRPGGYTRILKLSDSRLGDNAEMCIIELVDFNEDMETSTKSAPKAKTRRRGGKKKEADAGTTTDVKATKDTTTETKTDSDAGASKENAE